MTRAAPVTRGGSGRLILVALALVCGGFAVTGLPPSEPLVTTYGAASPTAHVLGQVTGLSLLVAGSLALLAGRARPPGALLVAAGVLWFAPDWAGWEGGVPLVRGVAAGVAPLLPVLLLAVLASLVGGRRARLACLAAGVVIGALSTGFVAVDDPFLDPACWPTCSDSAVLVTSRPDLADLLGQALAVARVVLGVAVGAAVVGRLVRASALSRRWERGLLGAMALTGGSEAAYGLALLARVESAEDSLFVASYLARAGAWTLLALTSVELTWRHRARRRALSRLAVDLERAPAPGSLAVTLRAVTGDRHLEVLYPVGRDGRHVSADGAAAAEATGTGRTSTPLRRGTQTVALLVHDLAVLPVDALDQVLGPAARLALENERLAAEGLARMHDVQASRRRIVTAGDEARRRLERDLHDGAQQSLLALAYTVRVARGAAGRSGQGVALAELDLGLAKTQAALDDLRDLAHGIHPAVLSEAGIGVALRSLAERSEVPLELAEVSAERFEPSIELAAYAVVRDATERAARQDAEVLVVRVLHRDDVLVLLVDGAPGEVPPEIHDRVGALGGRVAVTGTRVRVELPCGS